ncbi:MAG: rhomboid family intramembrane serine protease [Thermoplasmata archaeon]|uniref:Rhomboid family intramembrane serine protease n=1 Tax=candidate division WOR-3 bacterium TaxID=2052148 RepID=A0A7C1BE77_UNCW3|nr:MAG: rhomboid family intramembrane serine protease [Thermoplasmata archaeon]HDM90769.1 rhomboid family intramembrane serine protease [candidate division WOR-3 bacterium]
MLPLKDDLPSRGNPYVNYALIAINVLVFLYELSLGKYLNAFILRYGVIPYEYTHFVDIYPPSAIPINLITSMFLHGGLMHIGGNMLYLWIFGDNVEDAMGHTRYLLFYLICGIAASFTHIIFSAGSKVPSIGASGAISGVLAAYLILYPKAGVLVLIPDPFTFGLFYRLAKIPALVVLSFWIVFQFSYGLLSLPASYGSKGGVAWFAHIGGFVTGLLLVKSFAKYKHLTPYYRYMSWT